MSLIPLLSNWTRQFDNDYYHHHFDHLLDDDFGYGLHPMEIFHRPRPMVVHNQPKHRFLPYELALAPHHHPLSTKGSRLGGRLRGDSSGSSALLPTVGKDGFQVCMDVSQFKPNELTVKVVDKTVTVEGKHEEREDDHGMIQRHFVRKYTLPNDYDANEVVSTISSDGVLTLKAPPPANKALAQKERIVQIQQTGPAHLSVKAPENKEKQQGGADENGSAEKMETGK